MDSFVFILRASRDIKKDEEITIAYIDVSGSRKERQDKLDTLGFKCECLVCKDGEVADARRAVLRTKLDILPTGDPKTPSIG